jgi:hypothetical protein
MFIVDKRNSCFYAEITGTNTDFENAKAVYSHAVLYRSTENAVVEVNQVEMI